MTLPHDVTGQPSITPLIQNEFRDYHTSGDADAEDVCDAGKVNHLHFHFLNK